MLLIVSPLSLEIHESLQHGDCNRLHTFFWLWVIAETEQVSVVKSEVWVVPDAQCVRVCVCVTVLVFNSHSSQEAEEACKLFTEAKSSSAVM